MFGIGPTELAFFLVIVLLAVGPDKLPTFMRTVGKGLRQVRNASREFKEAIGLDELMREGDPFRASPLRPPRTRPVPIEDKPPEPSPDGTQAVDTPLAGDTATATGASPAGLGSSSDEPEPSTDPDAPAEAKNS
jgi:Sec-independent protein translocase protein TatA